MQRCGKELNEDAAEKLSRDTVIEGELNEIRGELNEDDLGVAANARGSKSSKRRNPKWLLESHPMLSPCACKRKCLEDINAERRKSIHSEFWEMPQQLRQEFLFQRVSSHEKQWTRVRVAPKKPRNYSRKYTFKKGTGDVQQVCSQFFLGTLGYKKDNMIAWLFQNQSPRKTRISASTFSPDQRGHVPKHKMPEDVWNRLIGHIHSYHPSVSHYRCAHASLKLIFPQN